MIFIILVLMTAQWFEQHSLLAEFGEYSYRHSVIHESGTKSTLKFVCEQAGQSGSKDYGPY